MNTAFSTGISRISAWLVLLCLTCIKTLTAQTYCWPNVQMACFYNDKITRVTFAGIDHTDDVCTTDSHGRKDFTSTVPPAQVNAGSTYSISVAVENNLHSGTEYVRIWIDFNRDGTFAGDESFDLGVGTGNTTLTNNNIAIPAHAAHGVTRMRVMYRRSNPLTAGDACHSYAPYRGQAKDYAVDITSSNPVLCDAPVLNDVSGIAQTGATISWMAPDPAPGNGYEYVVSPNNATPMGSGTPVSGTSVPVSGLTASRDYFVFVRAICENGNSNWVSQHFRTEDPPCGVAVALQVQVTGSTSATVSWTAPVPAPANGYEYVLATSNVPPSGNGTHVPSGTSVVLSGLQPLTTYFVFVRALCSSTSVSPWVMKEFNTPERPPCLAPAGLTVTNTGTASARLNWTLPLWGEPTAYQWMIVPAPYTGPVTEYAAATGMVYHPIVTAAAYGLPSGTSFNAYIRSICGSDTSNWTEVTKFATPYDVGIPEREYANIRLFPNPAGDHVLVSLESQAHASLSSIRVTDLSGREIAVQHSITATGSIRLNTEALPAGIYLLQVRSGERLALAKLVKQ